MKKKTPKISLKKIKVLAIILLIVLVVCLIFLIRAKSNSREVMLKKVLSGLDNLNYTYTDGITNEKVQVYGKYEKRTLDSENSITYIDYEKGTSVTIYPETYYMEQYGNKGLSDIDYYQRYIETFFNNDYNNYKYKGKKMLDDKKCYVVEFSDKTELDGRKNAVEFWINTSTNVIEKVEYLLYNKNKKTTVSTLDLNLCTNVNQLENVKMPDSVLKEYSSETDG